MLVTDFRVRFSTPLRNIRELMHVYWWCFFLKKNKILRMDKFEDLIPGTKNEIFAHVV